MQLIIYWETNHVAEEAIRYYLKIQTRKKEILIANLEKYGLAEWSLFRASCKVVSEGVLRDEAKSNKIFAKLDQDLSFGLRDNQDLEADDALDNLGLYTENSIMIENISSSVREFFTHKI